MATRFNDQNKSLSDFKEEVWIVCPSCAKKAITKEDYEKMKAILFCESCGMNKQTSTEISLFGISGKWPLAAHSYFEAQLS